MKDYHVTVQVNWVNAFEATDEEDAKEMVRELFREQFDLNISDDEIISVEEV